MNTSDRQFCMARCLFFFPSYCGKPCGGSTVRGMTTAMMQGVLARVKPGIRLAAVRHASCKGIRENFSEYEVRLMFDDWLKSLWLAPNEWVHSTRDRSIRVTRLLIPFWSFDFQGSVQCSLSTKSNLPFRHGETYYSHREWHSFPLQLDDVEQKNINVYAGEAFDRYHIQRLDVSFDDDQLVDLTSEDATVMKPTVSKDQAFHRAWVLIIKPLLHNMCLERAKEKYPKFEDPRIDSFHLSMKSGCERLLYYPIYVIDYHYRSKVKFSCFVDGVTGHITGDRQFSATKVTVATFAGLYPLMKIGIFAFGTMADLLFAFEVASSVSFVVTLPLAMIIAPCVGLYASSYPKLYKKELSGVQWDQDQSRALRFTYSSQRLLQEEKFAACTEGADDTADADAVRIKPKKHSA